MHKDNKIKKSDVEHVAKLARIKITESEKELYSKQLSSIIEYVDQLKEVDTKDVEPTTHITGLKNVMRADEPLSGNAQEELIDAAPESERDMVKVRSVLKGGKQ